MPRKLNGNATAAKQNDNQALLIETATNVKNMSERLFGGVGQPDGGALHFIMTQQKDLSAKLEQNKTELLDKIEGAKTTLQENIDLKKKATDEDIDKVRTDYTDLDRKVTRWSGGIATFQFLLMACLAALGLKYKAH